MIWLIVAALSGWLVAVIVALIGLDVGCDRRDLRRKLEIRDYGTEDPNA